MIQAIVDSRPGYWLSFVGVPGTGKTHLARKINRAFRDRVSGTVDPSKSPGIWRKKGGLVHWGKTLSEMMDGNWGMIEHLQEDWFVALDDIGTEYDKHRALSASKLYDVLEARMGRFTVITANMGLEHIGNALDARIASRMIRAGNIVIEAGNEVPDFSTR